MSSNTNRDVKMMSLYATAESTRGGCPPGTQGGIGDTITAQPRNYDNHIPGTLNQRGDALGPRHRNGIAWTGVASSPESGPRGLVSDVASPADHYVEDYEDQDSVVDDYSVSQDEQRETSALDEFLSAKPIKADPDIQSSLKTIGLAKPSASPLESYRKLADLPQRLRLMVNDCLKAKPSPLIPSFASNQKSSSSTFDRAFSYKDSAGSQVRMSEIVLRDRQRCIVRIAESSSMPAAIVKFTLKATRKNGIVASYLKWVEGDTFEDKPSVFKVAADGRSRSDIGLPRKPVKKITKHSTTKVPLRADLAYATAQPKKPTSPWTYTTTEELPRPLQRMMRLYYHTHPSGKMPEFCSKNPRTDGQGAMPRYEDALGQTLRMSAVRVERDWSLHVLEGQHLTASMVKLRKSPKGGREGWYRWLGGNRWETEPCGFEVRSDGKVASRTNVQPPTNKRKLSTTPAPRKIVRLTLPRRANNNITETPAAALAASRPAIEAASKLPNNASKANRAGATISTRSGQGSATTSIDTDQATFAFYLETSIGNTMRKRNFRDCDTIEKFFAQAAKVHRFSSSGEKDLEAVSCRIAQLLDEPEQMLFKDDEDDYLALVERVRTYLEGRDKQAVCVIEVRILAV